MQTAKARPELKRQLGLGAAAALIVGEVIAVGIFLTPAGMAKSLGSPMWMLIVWLTMGGMAICGALCYGELSARFPEAGGGYVYLREAYGPRFGFLYGWMSCLVMDPGLTAALAAGLGSYAAYLMKLSPFEQKLIGVGAIIVLAGVNILGVRLSARLLKGLTVLKIGFLIFLALWGFGFGLGNWHNFAPFVAQHEGSEPLVDALAGGMVLGFFSFGGWWDASKIAGEVKDPKRTMPRAMLLGISLVIAVYILTSAVFLYLVPLEQVTTRETFAAQAGEALFGQSGGRIFSAIVIVSLLGSMAALIMSAPRVYYAMARDGLFPSIAAKIHPRFGTPVLAIVLQATLASLLVAVGTFDEIIAYFFFVTVIFITMTVAGVFVLRRKGKTGGEYRIAGYPWTPLFFLFLMAILLVLLLAHDPKHSLLGVVVVILGAPVYELFSRRKSLNDR